MCSNYTSKMIKSYIIKIGAISAIISKFFHIIKIDIFSVISLEIYLRQLQDNVRKISHKVKMCSNYTSPWQKNGHMVTVLW